MPDPGLLVKLPNWVGDVVMALPTLEALGRRHGVDLALAGKPRLVELARAVVPRAQDLSRQRHWRGPRAALLLDGSWRSVLRARAAGIGCVVGIRSGGRGALLHLGQAPAREVGGSRGPGGRRLPRPFSTVVAELAGALPAPWAVSAPSLVSTLPLEPSLLDQVSQRLRGEGLPVGARPWVLVNAGGREGSTKGLPLPWLVELHQALEAQALPSLFVAGPGEEPRLEGLRQEGARVLSGPALGLLELAAAGAHSSVSVSPDGGGRHLLRAGGARLVSLFGPTDVRHALCPGAEEVRLSKEVPCGPCHLERCPLRPEDLHRCYPGVPAALEAVEMLLASET